METVDPAAVDVNGGDAKDSLYDRLRSEAIEAECDEPELSMLLRRTILSPTVSTFDEAIAATVAHRLFPIPASSSCNFCPNACRDIILRAFQSDHMELGHTMSEAIRQDVLAVCERDPACDSILEVVLFYKGFAALVCHRAAQRAYFDPNKKRRSMVALFLQSQASAMFGVDIHPASRIGMGVFLDHGTGIVIGETAVVEDGCTILQEVTLGGTGKDSGDRHPKVGKHVLIGAGAKILGNVRIGDCAKIGAGSIVLRPIPSHATAVGVPAKIIGRAREADPANTIDEQLEGVRLLHKKHSKVLVKEAVESFAESSNQPSVTETDSETSSDSGGNTSSSRGPGSDDCPFLCPFRDLKEQGKKAPPGAFTICQIIGTLHKANIGLTKPEIGEVYFEVDKELNGYVLYRDLLKRLPKALRTKTTLDLPAMDSVVVTFSEKAESDPKNMPLEVG